MRSQNEATHQLLQDVITRLGLLPAGNTGHPIRTCTSDTTCSSSIPTSSASQKKNFLKPSAPSEFDDNCSAGKTFLTSCQTYIRLCLESFHESLGDHGGHSNVFRLREESGCPDPISFLQWFIREIFHV